VLQPEKEDDKIHRLLALKMRQLLHQPRHAG